MGCANGWRLKEIRKRFGWSVFGIDPSWLAIEEGKAGMPDNALSVGVAESLPYPDKTFDLVIIGYMLWLADPEVWFRIASEVDRVLTEGGLLIVHDFAMPRLMRWVGWAPPEASEREKATTA